MRSQKLILSGIVLLHAAAAFILLWSPWCMFTSLRMQINDYGTYMNAIWNTAHGEPFRYLMDESYLKTHLSFTLALLSPLYWIWDHPFALAVVQWLCGVAGSVMIARIASRRGLPPVLAATLGLFFLAYASMQSVLLCDFHGVCLYFVLFPWLYHELTKQRLLALAPLALVMGLREEAALLVIPMILYFAVTRRWRAGYILAAAAFLYSLLAITALYPLINGITLWSRRAGELAEKPDTPLVAMINRIVALAWLFLPAIPLLRRRTVWPVVIFPLAALLIAMPSTNPYIHALDKQYPAAPFALLVLGLIEALVIRRADAPAGKFNARYAAFLFACVVAAHFGMGRLPFGHKNETRDLFLTPSPYGLAALHAARSIPKHGILLTTAQLSGITANRRDVLLLGRLDDRHDRVEIVFAGWTHLFEPEGEKWIARVREGEFSAVYFDHNYAVLVKGAPRGPHTDELLAAAEHATRTVIFSRTAFHRGDIAHIGTYRPARHWHGRPGFGPAILSHAEVVKLDAGNWTARLLLKANEPRKTIHGHWGLLQLHADVKAPPFFTAPVDPAVARSDEPVWQNIEFDLREPTDVEVRFLSGDAELWIERIIFVPREATKIPVNP